MRVRAVEIDRERDCFSPVSNKHILNLSAPYKRGDHWPRWPTPFNGPAVAVSDIFRNSSVLKLSDFGLRQSHSYTSSVSFRALTLTMRRHAASITEMIMNSPNSFPLFPFNALMSPIPVLQVVRQKTARCVQIAAICRRRHVQTHRRWV